MATTVKITETYDLRTTIGKIGLIGVHTPTLSLLRKLYPGLLKNHRFIRFVKCDVVGACASYLPADPLQVGVSAGEVAPEDMFNPILYTAVTNTSFDSIVARIRALTDISTLNSVQSGGLIGGDTNNFNAYYALLSENGKYRKVMPQSGFSIKNLVPLAHTVISNYGNVGPIGNTIAAAPEEVEYPDPEVPSMDVPIVNGSSAVVMGDHSVFYRGKAIRMPRIPIHNGLDFEAETDIPNPNVPETLVLALIVPPAKLHEFYYRMRVSWYVRFEEVCSTLEAGGPTVWNSVGPQSYASSYTFAKSESQMPVDSDMVSTQDVDLKKIMES